ncbi:MAG: dTDP-4-dehydrorhamnose 3,5-epimerase [Candidatus Omnitrophica bacterium]|nr:dTDP-4-dehydrorhamnose 3,5-epimerase [Candidatus Omnitrophota bacterium]MDE2223228.1 dTDP-4-dehydrorhamnose 3,5-epimerase [Candidatus Omnitrophota bacterium]
MTFTELFISGAFLIDLELREDERGFFARLFCEKEFAVHGLMPRIVQVNDSYCKFKGTLRGMHYQLDPHSEDKMVRCLRGRIFDVVLDLRKSSPTFGRWYGCELTQDNRKMLYIPKMCAHGFITLEDDSEILYLHSQFHAPSAERGVRWDDPKFKIQWPFKPKIISKRDQQFPLYT